MEAWRRLLVKSKVNYDRKVKKSPNDDVVQMGAIGKEPQVACATWSSSLSCC